MFHQSQHQLQNFVWKNHPVLCGVMAAVSPKSKILDAVPYCQSPCLYSSLSSELDLLYASVHTFWLACALTLLFFFLHLWVPAKAFTNINQFSPLAYSERISVLGPSLKQFWIVYLTLDLCESPGWIMCINSETYSGLILPSKKWCTPCEHCFISQPYVGPFLYRTL